MSFLCRLATVATIAALAAAPLACSQAAAPGDARPVAAHKSDPLPVELNVPYHAQDTEQWCWVAVAQMVLAQRTSHVPRQCELVESFDRREPGSCCANVRNCMRCAVDLPEVQRLLHHNGLESERLMAPVTPERLREELSNGSPIIVQIGLERSRHAVVVSGLRYVDGIAVLTVNDPATERHDMTYEELNETWIDLVVVER